MTTLTQDAIQESINQMADYLAEMNTIPNSPLGNLNVKKEFYREKIKKSFDEQSKECKNGITLISENIMPNDQAQFKKDLLDFIEEIKNLPKYSTQVKNGQSLRSVCNASDFLINKLYQAALIFFNTQKWTETVSCFTVLVLIDPTTYEFSACLGTALLHLERYEDALVILFQALPHAPDSSIYLPIIECFMKLGMLEETQKCLEMAIAEEQNNQNPDKEMLSVFEELQKQLNAKEK